MSFRLRIEESRPQTSPRVHWKTVHGNLWTGYLRRFRNKVCRLQTSPRFLWMADHRDLWTGYGVRFLQPGVVGGPVLSTLLSGEFSSFPKSFPPTTIPCHFSWGFLLLQLRLFCQPDIGRNVKFLFRTLTCRFLKFQKHVTKILSFHAFAFYY